MKMPTATSIAPFAFSLLLAVQCPTPAVSEPVRALADEIGIGLSVASDGSFEVTTRTPEWTFAGHVGSPLSDIALQRGRDRAGGYRQVEFKFKPSATAMRLGAIRVYDHRPVVVFKLTFLTAGKTSESFPSISNYPRNLHHLAYTSTFGGFSFERFGTDGPWLFFDDKFNTFILSPASHYMNAALSIGPHEELIGGIAADSENVLPGFAMTSALVNRAFDIWGRFLTDLAGKKRPANDADVSLKYLGYWTDHGARYYYRFEDALGYAGTLLEVRHQFRTMNIRLGYVQLDSWFYPKGRDGTWKSEDPLGGGTYRYEASRELFADGLAAFRRRLGLPLVVHNRWIDVHSPYRARHAMSGNVSTDPALWAAWMRYLRKSGVRVYEQDWLSGPATPARDLLSGELFMDTMASAAAGAGITLQYCMPLPRHFLQGTRYSNLSTIRVSGDRFGEDQWASFLFNGRLASALGEWPWTDVFMSSETSNLLLATLSASIVGVGDALGQFDRANLDRVVRADGLIVKPDDAIAPLDSSYVEQAKDRGSPIVAAARTRHAGSITSYVFAFAQAAEPRTARISPAALGYGGPVYAYNAFEGHGRYLQPLETLEFPAPADGVYWIVVPVGPSGVGFLGDPGKFVSNSRNRVERMRDTGVLIARIVFSAGESRLRLQGFSRARPKIRAARARVENLIYDSRTGLFQFDLLAKPGTSPVVALSAL
jgi:hypothetical protein